MNKRIYRLKALVSELGLSKTTIYALIKEGQFPKPVSLTARSVGWKAEDIEEWLNSRKKVS
ncbi:AlpA family transcriptional regulator [Thiomicrorhabdus sp. Kp2]|uniref:helix-turn-helix transcriptional regulator n=1 Tax=Thiomicrorhabdus sp. Kp2 TaxID=1123518 RepID=UPI0003FFE4E9|nr:AlpA family transcriptional regulator [Thiomicrorhabdus sp. Kp2]